MKNGLIFENGELIYYRNDEPYHAGVIKVDNAIYYIGSDGRAVKGQHIVHQSMSNDILKRGTYTFGDDYKLVAGSYRAPKKTKPGTKPNSRRFASPFRMRWKELLYGCFLIAAMVVLAASAFWLDNTPSEVPPAQDGTQENLAPNVRISLPKFEEDVLLCSAAAKSEFAGELDLTSAVATGNPYRPFLFQYQFYNTDGVLLLSENQDLEHANTYDLPENRNYILIDNLKTGCTYYYRVLVGGQEYPGFFKTAPSTRFVSIPGLVNTRDIGGYTTQDGKTVRQGLLIRGVELDGLENANYCIPDEDLETVQETFGFRYDLDLRSAGIYSGVYHSPLGIPHKFYTAPMYGNVFTESGANALRSIFSDLADPDHYPMYLHCTWGKDRTGIIVFLLQGILNMSEEAMIREYELTGYTHPDMVGNGNMDVVINGLESYEGDTLQEKIITFLTTEVGVTEAEISAIRHIFLEELPS